MKEEEEKERVDDVNEAKHGREADVERVSKIHDENERVESKSI
jgi:hypothetical protein